MFESRVPAGQVAEDGQPHTKGAAAYKGSPTRRKLEGLSVRCQDSDRNDRVMGKGADNMSIFSVCKRAAADCVEILTPL